MKKILYIFWIVLFSIYNACFAKINITINSDSTSIDISELVELRIDVIATENETIWEVQIAGIESFNVVWQSVSNSTRIMNGNSSENYTLILTLKANKAWEYEIGPVKVWEITSNIVNLEVTWAEVFIGWQQDVAAWNVQIIWGGEVATSQDTNEKNQNKQEEEIQVSDEQLLTEYEASNSWTGEISGLMKNIKLSPIDVQKSAFAIIFLIVLFLAYKLHNIVKASAVWATKLAPVAPVRTDYYDLLDKIEEVYLKAEKNIFYTQLSNLLRRYLDEKVAPDLSSKTLAQVKSKLEKNTQLYKLYETIYYPEYNKEEDSPEQRLDILELLKQELQ